MEISHEYKIQPTAEALLQRVLPTPGLRDRLASVKLSARGRRVALFVLAICVINLFDLALTMQAHADGILDEQNPIAHSLLQIGPSALLIFKMSIIAVAGYVLFSCRRHRCAELASVLVLIAYIAVAVRWRICYEFYDMSSVVWQGRVSDNLFDPMSVLFRSL